MKDIIHFAHGNGFPALCYRQLLEQLGSKFNYSYIDKIGHDPMFPVSENWHYLVDEILSSVRTQAKQPVIAIGHSLGGVLSLLAAIEEPDLFKAVVLLDSPLIGPFKSSMIKIAKALGIIDRVTPAKRTKSRQQHWRDYDHLLNYLRTREFFQTFSEQCLNDYIEYGLELKEDGYYLRFDRHIEYEIYRTIPHHLPQFAGKLKVPAAMIYGTESVIVDGFDRRNMKKKFGIQSFSIKGTHLFPFEHPELSAKKIFNALDAIL